MKRLLATLLACLMMLALALAPIAAELNKPQAEAAESSLMTPTEQAQHEAMEAAKAEAIKEANALLPENFTGGEPIEGFNEAVNHEDSNLEFFTTGEYPWCVDEDYAGRVYGKSGVPHGTMDGDSTVYADVHAEAGDILRFEYQVRSYSGQYGGDESCYDYLYFIVNGNVVQAWCGRIDWTVMTYAIQEAGDYNFAWRYVCTSPGSYSSNAGYIDNVYFGAPIAVTGVETHDDELTIPTGYTANIDYTVYPEEAENKAVTFSSSNEAIATVDADGVVTGISDGIAIITVTTVDGGFTAECAVTVSSDLDVVEMYGYLDYDSSGVMPYDDWISFTNYTPNTVEYYDTGITRATYAAEIAGNKIYGFHNGDGATANGLFYIIDLETMTINYPSIDYDSDYMLIKEMAYNHAEQKMYGLCTGDGAATWKLCIIDRQTGHVLPTETVTVNGQKARPVTFAISPDGIAYCILEGYSGNTNGTGAQTGMLYTVDLETGVCTLVGDTGKQVWYVQSMTFDQDTGILYWAHTHGGSDRGLYTIDTQTGEAAFIGKIGNGEASITALVIPNDLEVDPPDAANIEVYFMDSFTGDVLGMRYVRAGQTLDLNSFPEAPYHEGYVFNRYDYAGEPIYNTTFIETIYRMPDDFGYGFETIDEVNEWTLLDQDGDGFNWDWVSKENGWSAYLGEHCMASMSFSSELQEALTPDNWLISPEIMITEKTEGASVYIYYKGQSEDFCYERFGVYVSTDGGETWSDELGAFVSWKIWQKGSVDLTEYAGQRIRVAFRHYDSTDQFALNIDTVEFSLGGTLDDLLMGDVDGNGSIDMQDAVLTARRAMNLIDDTALNVEAADVDSNGIVALADAVIIARMALNLI